MKSFTQIREKKRLPSGKPLITKRINKHIVSVFKNDKGFAVFVDGDKLDVYKTKRDAEKSAIAFAKEF